MRAVAKRFLEANFSTLQRLLDSKFHEDRLVWLFILVYQYQKKWADKQKIIDFYLKNLKAVNNWDLVDATAPALLGDFLLDSSHELLFKLAQSDDLWKKRIAMVSTLGFIKKGKLETSLIVAEMLMWDSHDLIHKAIGRVLREVGKKDEKLLEKFLEKRAGSMPRTALRYSIERLEEQKKKFFMSMKRSFPS